MNNPLLGPRDGSGSSLAADPDEIRPRSDVFRAPASHGDLTGSFAHRLFGGGRD